MMQMAIFTFIMAGVFITDRPVNGDQLLSDIVRNKPVMEVESQSHVDLFQLAGIWFEISHSPYNALFSSVASVLRYFSVEPDRRTITGYYAGAVNGTCLPAFKGQIQKFCDDGPADFFAKGITMPSPWGITKFLYTDYQATVIYFCSSLNENGTCRIDPMVTILSRGKTIAPEMEQFLQELIENKTGIPPEILIPQEYNEDCFPQITSSIETELGGDCVFSNIEAQRDFDPDKFSGKWYPVAALKFVQRPEMVNSPICYQSNGDGSLSVRFVLYQNDQCQTTDPFTIFPKNPINPNGDFLADRGLTFRPGDKVYSMFKVVYTDYEVAVGTGCFSVNEDGSCVYDFAGSAIVSRTPQLSPDKLEFLYDVLRNSCVNATALEEVQLTENLISCGCPDVDLNIKIDESKIPEEKPLAESVKLPEYSGQTLTQALLGSWFHWAASPSPTNADIPFAGPLRNHYTFGRGGHLVARTVLPINGTCAPALVAESEVLYEDGRSSVLLFAVAGKTSWYAARVVYIDKDLMIVSRCDDIAHCSLDPTFVRVIGRASEYDNTSISRVNVLLDGFGINAETMMWREHQVDCSHMIFNAEANYHDQSSCRTSRFEVHENFTVSAISGTWHIIAHYSYLNGSEAYFRNAVVHYRDDGNGSLSGFASITSASGGCLPLLRFKVHPRCTKQDGGEMYTEEDETVFKPDAPLTLSATWKVVYIDEDSAVVFNCQQEEPDGTCPPEKARISVMARSSEISEEKRGFLDDTVSSTCIEPQSLVNTTSTAGGTCLSKLKKVLETY